MFNRSEIMKAAWASVKGFYARRNMAFRFVQSDFNYALRCAWAAAKRETMTVVEIHAADLRTELARLPYKSSRINIEPRRRQIEAELSAIAA